MDAPAPEEAVDTFFAWLRGHCAGDPVLVGHNAIRFVLAFLEK